jgi:hypothetical protein
MYLLLLLHFGSSLVLPLLLAGSSPQPMVDLSDLFFSASLSLLNLSGSCSSLFSSTTHSFLTLSALTALFGRFDFTYCYSWLPRITITAIKVVDVSSSRKHSLALATSQCYKSVFQTALYSMAGYQTCLISGESGGRGKIVSLSWIYRAEKRVLF